ANTHFALIADAKGNIFMAGDTGVGQAGFAGNIYLFTNQTGLWTQLVDQTKTDGPVRPHADTRDFALSAGARGGSLTVNVGQLLVTNDGGIYRLDLATRKWSTLMVGGPKGDSCLRISE